MSSSIQASSSSTPNFQPIFEKALEEYKKKTGKDLTAHPLAAEIKDCNSSEAILTVLEGKANELNHSRSSDERLIKWLSPTVNILQALSSTLGDGAGLVFPPTKIIFSGLGILLVAAKSTLVSREVLAELFDRIESFFGRLKTYTEAPLSQTVTDVLIKTMAEVLSVLAIATKGMKERRTKTILKKLAGMNDIEDALQRLTKLEQGELLTVIAQTLRETSGLKEDSEEIKAMVGVTVNRMNACNLEDVLQKLRKWLSPADPSTNYNIGLRELHEETATWFLEGLIFREWQSTSSLLWIHGKPGSGKSIFCSAIIQRILSLSDGGGAFVAYFYFDFRDDNKKHRHNILPSLLVQFAAYSIPCCDIISHVYAAHGKGIRQPSDEVLIACLTDMLSAMSQQPIYIIVDALDECPNTSGVRSPRERVLNLIQDLVHLRLPNLHICATSRPEIDIRRRLEPLTSLHVSLHDQTGHKEDIAKYINSEVDYISSIRRWREGDKEVVVKTLSVEADGMFRWVYCQLEILRRCLPSRLRQCLKALPKGLDETYQRILKGIPEETRGHAQRLLQCLAVAIRPLRVEELAEILTFQFDAIDGEVLASNAVWRSKDQEQELLSACPGLITIVCIRGSQVVQFSHFSVKEFLTSDRLATSSEDISSYHILSETAHATLSQASLGVLLRLDDRIDSSKARDIPLVGYAAEHWISHAQVGSVSSRVMGAMKTLFDSDKPHFAAWVRIFDIDGLQRNWYPRWRPAGPLYYSTLCGFFDLVEHLLKKHSRDVNCLGGKYDYPLVAALSGRHIRVAELLLQHGANVNAEGREAHHLLQRTLASFDSFVVSAVQFLLKHGADVDARGYHNLTPLHTAAARGNIEVARMLLQHRADVNSRDSADRTPLHMVWAELEFPRAKGSRHDLIQLLLEYGAEVNSRDKKLATALHYTSHAWDLEAIRVLLNCGADAKVEDDKGRTPLHLLSEYQVSIDEDMTTDEDMIVQLLVEHGADVNARDKDHVTPLHFASYHLRLVIVKALLDHGAIANAEDNQGQTPLHRLSAEDSNNPYKDYAGISELLIEHGADVNAQDENHETPLHFASYSANFELVRALLYHGADVNAEDSRGRTPLHRVPELWEDNGDSLVVDDPGRSPRADYAGVARLLLEHGADVNARNKNRETPLHLASDFGELEVVRALLDHGSNVDAKDDWGREPLHRVFGFTFCGGGPEPAYSRDHLKDRFGIAQLLVDSGANVNAQGYGDETPLHLASLERVGPDPKLVRMLLDHGANVNTKDYRGWTPWDRVFKEDDGFYKLWHEPDVAWLMVEHGLDVNTRDQDRKTPLHLASHHLDLKLVQALLEHGASVKAEDNKGRTPLHEALRYLDDSGICLDVTQLLIENGADVNKQDNYHEAPLHRASSHASDSCLVALEVACVLLKHGADKNAKNKEGKIPFQLVQEEMKQLPSTYHYTRRRADMQKWQAQARALGVALMGLLYVY